MTIPAEISRCPQCGGAEAVTRCLFQA